MSDFEDVPLDITSKTLCTFYKEAFRTHVMDKAEDEIEILTAKANDTATKISRVKEIMQDNGAVDQEVKSLILQIKADYDDMKSTVKAIGEDMEKVEDKMAKAERMRVEVEKRISELEPQMVELTTQGVLLEERTAGVEVRDDENGPENSQSQHTASQSSDQRSSRGRMRSAIRKFSKKGPFSKI